jgi:hypothetical protein
MNCLTVKTLIITDYISITISATSIHINNRYLNPYLMVVKCNARILHLNVPKRLGDHRQDG